MFIVLLSCFVVNVGICGYVYDEAEEAVPFEDLPADWTCPWCKHGKQDFELQA